MKQYIAIKSIIIFLFLLLYACQKEEIDSSGFTAAKNITEEVRKENIRYWVETLYNAHINDNKVDSTGFQSDELFPASELSRDSAVGIVARAFKDMDYIPDTIDLGEEPLVAYNVVVELKGVDKPDEVVLIGGHLDAFYGGADDNTTAIAALLEAARVLQQFQFKRTIRFVAFDLEEFGSIGSTRYIQAGYAHDVVSAVVMDLIGYKSVEPNSQDDIMGVRVPHVGDYLFTIGNNNSAELTQKIVNMGNVHGLAKTHGIIASGDGTSFLTLVFMRSDHALFWMNGIPAVFFTDGANFRNPHYHKISDTPETLDFEFLTDNVKLIVASIALMAEVTE